MSSSKTHPGHPRFLRKKGVNSFKSDKIDAFHVYKFPLPTTSCNVRDLSAQASKDRYECNH